MLLPALFSSYRPRHRINVIAPAKQKFDRAKFGGVVSILGLITAAFLFCLLTSVLRGADITPVEDLDTQATSDVSSAIVRKPQQIVTGFSFRHINAPVASSMLDHEDDDLKSSIRKYAAGVGLGINRYWQMDLSINATQSQLNNDQNSGNKFAGAMLASKLGAYQSKSIGLALVPFLETPSQSGADDDFARSGKMKGGWAAMASYVASGILQVNLEGGFRYRQREEFANISLRNESFYRVSLEAFLGRMVSLFSSAEGRSIKISNEHDYLETGHRDYRAENSASFNGGLKLILGATEMAAYAGKSLGNEIFGQGKTQFGASVAYIFGSKRTAAPATRLEIADDEKKDAEIAAAPGKTQSKASNNPNAILDPYGNEIDMTSEYDKLSSGKNDDFRKATRKVQAQSKTPGGPDEGYAFEAELEKIHDAEQKAQVQEEGEKRTSEATRQSRARQQLKEDRKKEQELRRDVLKNEKLPEVTDEEANWQILD